MTTWMHRAYAFFRLPLPGLRKVGVMCDRKWSWYGLDPLRLFLWGLRHGIQFVPLVSPLVPGRLLEAVTAENARSYRYRGYALFPAVEAALSIEYESLASQLDYSHPGVLARLTYWYGRCVRWIDQLERLQRAYGFRTFLYVQGYYWDAALVRQLGVRTGARTIALEGSFRRGYLPWEDAGGLAVNRDLARNFFWRIERERDPAESRAYLREVMANIRSYKQLAHQSPEEARELGFAEGRRVLLYIGQVYTDTATIFGLRSFPTPEDLIEAIAEEAEREDFAVVFKLHPKEVIAGNPFGNSYSALTRRKLQAREALWKRLQDRERFLVDDRNEYGTYALLQQAAAVLTVNSQAGFEALAHGCPVILCGTCFYGGLGFTEEVYEPRDLAPALARALSAEPRRPDADKFALFFHSYFEDYCLRPDERRLVERLFVRP